MDTPLLQLSAHPDDAWCLRDAMEGVQIFGGTGSGKTSGSGRALAEAFLRSGMGGIVLCAKPDEADAWVQYAKEAGREKSIIRFDAEGRYRFNFLDYEMNRNPAAADIMAANVVNALLNILEVASRGTSLASPSAGDAFWIKSSKMLLGHTVDMLYATYGRIRLTEMLEFIESAPQSPQQMKDEHWKKHSFFFKTFEEFYATGGGRHPPDIEDIKRLKNFWMKNFPTMAEKTRSNIVTTLTSDLDPLLRGRMRKIFCTSTNIVPEMAHEGAIILLDFPIKIFNEAGILAQQVFKFFFQRSTERRSIDDDTRPVFIWSDECHFFLSAYDMEFQSTARSSKACTVMLSQNLPTFISTIGGQVPRETVHALLGNLRTKILHSNTDMETNKWATEVIGRETVWRATHGENQGWNESQSASYGESWSDAKTFNWNDGENYSTNASRNYNSDGSSSRSHGISQGISFGKGITENESSGGNRSSSSSRGSSGGSSQSMTEHRDNAVDPEDFGRDLRTGGKRNGYMVSGVVIQGGRRFGINQKNWLHVFFDQRS